MAGAAGPARRTHRWLLLLTALVVAVDLGALVAGLLTARQALFLVVAVELPMGAVALALNLRAYRSARRAGHDPRAALGDALGTRFVTAAAREVDALRAIWLFGTRQQSPRGHRHIGYGAGLMGTVLAFCVVSGVEIVVLHVLVPAPWVRTLLLVLGLYALVVVVGLTVSRIVFPHYVSGHHLHLRQGSTEVLRLDLGDIAAVTMRRRIAVVGLFPKLIDDRLHLPSQDGTNLDLTLARPITVRVGLSRAQRRSCPEGVSVLHVSLHVDNPADAADVIRQEQTRASAS